jgi:hypothetical protein
MTEKRPVKVTEMLNGGNHDHRHEESFQSGSPVTREEEKKPHGGISGLSGFAGEAFEKRRTRRDLPACGRGSSFSWEGRPKRGKESFSMKTR